MATITRSAEGQTAALTWKDTKRYWWLLGLAVPMLPSTAYVWGGGSGLDIFYWVGPIVILLVIPLLDHLVGTDKSNPPDWAIEQLAEDRYYRWVTYLYLPLQFAGFLWAAWVVTHQELSWFAYIGYALTVGCVGGIGIANAHELGHKKEKVERWLSKVVLAQTAYGHFYVEHNRGHHARVATPEDPASARFGESFWAFLPRSVVGGARSAWRLEKARFTRQNKTAWTLKNDVLNAWVMSAALFAVMIAVLGPKVIPFLVIQGIFGFSLLEVVNYIEHYGLMRQKDATTGRYERCNPQHSWNSNNTASNVFLYHLERHSDHHSNPTRRYQTLRHFEESPQLPSGYALMIGLAYIPPVWRAVMDKRVLDHYDGDITQANIQPSKRAKVLAAHGAA